MTMHSLAYTVGSKKVPSPDLKQLNASTIKVQFFLVLEELQT